MRQPPVVVHVNNISLLSAADLMCLAYSVTVGIIAREVGTKIKTGTEQRLYQYQNKYFYGIGTHIHQSIRYVTFILYTAHRYLHVMPYSSTRPVPYCDVPVPRYTKKHSTMCLKNQTGLDKNKDLLDFSNLHIISTLKFGIYMIIHLHTCLILQVKTRLSKTSYVQL